MKTGGLPAGSYTGAFERAEKWTENSDKFGEAVLLVFEVGDGELQGLEGSRIVSAKMTPKSNLTKFVTALLGRTPEPGEAIDLEGLYGTKGLIIVEEHNDGTRVSTFLKQG